MMTIGIQVLACFAAIWAILGLAMLQLNPVWFVLPVAVSGLAVLAANALARDLPSPPPAEQQRIKRLVLRWSMIEGIGIFIALALVFLLQRPQLGISAMCLVVGLHFLPLARGLPKPIYYASALVLIALALAGLTTPALATPGLVALGAALCLWLTILVLCLQLAMRTAATG